MRKGIREKKLSNQKEKSDLVIITHLISLASYTLIASRAWISEVTLEGLKICIDRTFLADDELKGNLKIDSIVGEEVGFHLHQMNLDMEGTVISTNHIGKGVFEVFISFRKNVPKYWRKCLLDLVPKETLS